MKKALLVLAFFGALNTQAQVWFDVGLKGGVGAGFLTNSTLSSDSRFGISPGLNFFYGGKVGVNYGEYIGLAIDVDYGKYNYGFLQSEVAFLPQDQSYKYQISYNALNVAPLIRYTKESGYLELGPQFQFGRNQEIQDEAFPTFAPHGPEYVRSGLTGLIFGFGGHFVGNEIISLMAGLRFNYVFSNLTSDAWSDSSFPFTNYPDISEPSKTSPINAQLVLELNYSLGYIVRASCGKRTAFLTF